MSTNNIDNIVTILNQGGLILYPTDTIWGLGCDPFNTESLVRLNYLKNRDPAKKFILLVNSIAHLKRYIPHIHPRIETLLFYHTHPLTVVYKNPVNLPEHLVSEDNTIAIRLILDPFCQRIIEAFDRPLVSTSANVSGDPFPKNKSEISDVIIKGVDLIVSDEKNKSINPSPSVIVTYNRKGDLIFLRE